MPAARTGNDGGDFILQRIFFPFRAGVGQREAGGIAHVNLPLQQVFPRGRIGVLEVCHPTLRPGIKRVDRHFAIYWTRNFRAPIK